MKPTYEKPTLTEIKSILHIEGLKGDSQDPDANDDNEYV